jgi:heptosyltransferase II
LLLTDAVSPLKKRQHLVLTYKELLQPLGIAPSSTSPKLYLLPEEIAQARQLLISTYGISADRPLVGINPGAAYGSAKCWLPERFREVALEILDKTDATVLFFGDAGGAALTKQICRDLPPRVLNLAGTTSLRELMCLIHLCDVLLTNDSGPMHMAAALGTDVVALFGSTDPVVTGPYGQGIVIQKQVSCSPCFQRTCPIDFRCMKGITSEEVISSILKILQKRS